jgi:hypothetical protein
MNVLVVVLDSAAPLDVHDADVLAVAPALNSRLRHWLNDDAEARRIAEERLAACLDRLERTGSHASGRIGDADPVQAIADALPTFAADEIVIAAHAGRTSRLGHDVAERARRRFAVPVHEPEERLAHAA